MSDPENPYQGTRKRNDTPVPPPSPHPEGGHLASRGQILAQNAHPENLPFLAPFPLITLDVQDPYAPYAPCAPYEGSIPRAQPPGAPSVFMPGIDESLILSCPAPLLLRQN